MLAQGVVNFLSAQAETDISQAYFSVDFFTG